MKFKALKDLYSGKFFSKDTITGEYRREDFICLGQDGALYEQVNFDEFVLFVTPLYEDDGSVFDIESALEKAIIDDFEFAEIASGENEGEKYTVTLNTSGKAELLVQGKNVAGEDDWFSPRCDDEKWVGFITLPEGIEWE